MKNVLAISLLILISLITVKEAVYIALFQANQNYITANFCEQNNVLAEIQDKTCQGKCYVQKVIVEQHEDNSSNNQLIPTLDWEKTNLIIQNFSLKITNHSLLKTQPFGRLLADNQGIEINITSPPQV